MTNAYFGIDVACAKGKLLPVVACVREGARLRALPLRQAGVLPPRGMGNRLALDESIRAQFAHDTVAYVEAIERIFDVRATHIAIDAPRTPSPGQRRQAELAMDRAGISCIATPTVADFAEAARLAASHLAAGGSESRLPRANQIWMLVGFDLFAHLGRRFPCFEVFPQAIARAVGVVTITSPRKRDSRTSSQPSPRRPCGTSRNCPWPRMVLDMTSLTR